MHKRCLQILPEIKTFPSVRLAKLNVRLCCKILLVS